jgi:hypothetical protein
VVTTVLAVSLGAAIPSAAAPAAPDPATPDSRYGVTEPVAEVTLVTGDVVTVGVAAGGELSAEVSRPAPRPDGRPALHSIVRDGDALYVYPSDAMSLVSAGRLDRKLFDVEYLVRNGYDDATSPALPLIVQYPATVRGAGELDRRADALPAGDDALALPSVNGAAVALDKAEVTSFWSTVTGSAPAARTLQRGLATVWLDGRVAASLDESVPMVGAPEAWAAGYDGTGATVAVLDTGIDASHPDLAGKVRASENFVGGPDVTDGHGHGTHVAATITGSGAAAGGRYQGVAPGAELLVGKVLSDAGTGTNSQAIAGMQWAVQQGADVVNLSLGGCCTDGTDPMSQAVNTLTAESGTLFVVAAGNNGARGSQTINTPGAADAALTVAAVDKQDGLAGFSSRGPRPGDFGRKPDIAAPGVAITAARADGTEPGPVVDDAYTTISGTSMATPHVAGAAAILAQQHPDWAAGRLKDTLMSTAADAGHGGYEQGAGRLDVARASSQGVYATGGVDFGKLPYDQTEPVTRTITYVNDTDAPVTLELNATLRARRGPAPDGILRIEPATVTVPAGGSAPVTATFDPSAGPDSWYEGAVHARADGIEVTTAVGGFRDLPRVRFTGEITPPDGATDLFWGGWLLVRIDGRDEVPAVGEAPELPEVSGELYAGHYAVRSFVQWRDRDGAPQSALIIDPDVDATSDATVRFDLRRAHRLTTDTPRPAEPYAQQVGFVSVAAGGALSARSEVRLYGENTLWTLPAEQPSLGEFYGYTQQVLTERRLTMRVSGQHTTLDARYPVPNLTVQDDEIARFDGQRTLPLVDAGSGTADDFESVDVAGKLALLDLSEICAVTCTDYGLDRVRAAEAAGAVGVLGFGSAGQGFLDPNPYASRYVWPAYPVPTVSLPADQGRRLRDSLADQDLRLEVTAPTDPSYVYALSFPWVDGIPTRPDTSVGNRELYRIDNRIHADGPGKANLTWNAQLAGAGDTTGRIGQSNAMHVSAPSTVTTYFGPVRGDVGWSHGASVTYHAPDPVANFHRSGWSETRIEEFPRGGGRADDLGEHPLVSNTTRYEPNVERYFTPTCLSCRNGDMLNPVHVLSADGGDGYQAYDITNGRYGDPQTELHLYRDGVEVPIQSGIAWIAPPWIGYQNPYFTLAPERATYRLTEHFETYRKMQRYARTVDTEWTFSSERPSTGFTSPDDGGNCMGWYLTWPNPPEVCQATSQLFVGYDLGLDLENTLPAGRAHLVTVSAYHSQFLDPAPKVRNLKLWMSVDDGAQWSAVPVWPLRDGRYAALLFHPRLDQTTGAVSLRVHATDAAGNAIEQTVHRAYGLR